MSTTHLPCVIALIATLFTTGSSAEPALTQPSPDSTAPSHMAAVLKRKIPEVKLDGVGVNDTLDFLRDVSGANIFIDGKRLKIDPNTPIRLDVKNVSFGYVLSQV